MIRLFLMFLLACVASSRPAFAQAEPTYLDGKPLPKVARKNAFNQAWAVWIAYDGFVPLSKPESSSPRIEVTKLKFMQKCFFVERKQALNDVEYYCLGSEEGGFVDGVFQVNKVLGWVPAEYVITSSEAKQLDREDGKVRGMHRKAIIVNTEDQLFKDRFYSETVSLRRGPSLASQKVTDLRLFSFFFIYGETGKGTATTADDFTLLGAAQQFDDLPPGTVSETSNTPERVVLGWVPSERLVEWNSREAVYWDFETSKSTFTPRRTEAGKLWKSPADAYSGQPEIWKNIYKASRLPVPTLKPTPERLPPEEVLDPETGESASPDYDAMLFPILEWNTSSLADKTYKQKLLGTGWQLAHVGVLADFVAGDVRVSSRKVAEFQARIDEYKKRAKITEVLFVVDDTSSMRDWYDKYTVEAIKKIVQKAQVGQREVRIAISYYNDNDVPLNDRKDGYVAPGVEVGPLISSLNASALAKLIEDSRAHAHRGGGGGPLEMLHQGLYTAITKTDFDLDSQKFIVILGDYGDRGGGPSIKEVANEVRRLGENSLILAIHVAESTSKIQQDPDLAAFADSVKQLIAEVEAGRESKLSLYEPVSRLDSFLVKIEECYQRLEENLKQYQLDLENAKRGSLAKSVVRQLQRDVSDDKEMQELIAALSEGKGAQFFYEGYAWLYDGDNPSERAKGYMYPYILATTGEIEQVAKLVSGVKRDSSATITELTSGATSVTAAQVPVAISPVARDYAQDIDESALAQTLTIMRWLEAGDKTNKLTLSNAQLAILLHKKELLEDALNENRFTYNKSMTLFNGTEVPEWKRVESSKKHLPRLWVVPGLSEDSPFKWIWIDRRQEWP
jgi:hypothetical protein